MRFTRPLSVTLLALAVLTFASLNLLRFIEVIRLWSFLKEHLSIPPLYLALSGAAWGGVGLFIAWGLWRGKRRMSTFVVFFVLAYSIYYWIDRLWVVAEKAANWPFAVGVNIALLSFVFLTLRRSQARAFFGDLHEYRN
jgi:hypothetical protein